MQTEININDNKITFNRNSFTGRFTYTINDQSKVLQSAFDPRTHFWFTLKRKYSIKVNSDLLEIIQERPLAFSFAKPHLYTFLLNGELIKTIKQ